MFAKLISLGGSNIDASINCKYGSAPVGMCGVGMFPKSGACRAGALGMDV